MRPTPRSTFSCFQSGVLLKCSTHMPRSLTSFRQYTFKAPGPCQTSSQRNPKVLQASFQQETQGEKVKGITIPVKSKSDVKIVGAALAQVFLRDGTGSVVCQELDNLEKCYRVISFALSLLSPDVWLTFREVGRLSKHPDGTVFRSLKFTLKKGLGSTMLNTGYEEFQVTAKTESQSLAIAVEMVLRQRKIVGLRSVGFQALLTATYAAKKLRRDYGLTRDVLVVRPKVSKVREGSRSFEFERFEITCARIPFYKDEKVDPREGFGWKNAKDNSFRG